jgi:hypothetical protein
MAAFSMESCFQVLVRSGVRMKIPSFETGLILILNCTLKKVVKDRVAEYVLKNRCLGTVTIEKEIEGEIVYLEIDCEKPAHRRGRCKECYDYWYNARRSMTDQEKVQFDHALIEMGRLLTQQGKRNYERQDLIARLARKVKKRA